MEDKLHWMYWFWVLLSAVKSIQSFVRIADYKRMGFPVPTGQWLFTAFWSVAVLFYTYMIWRNTHPRPRTRDRRRPTTIIPSHTVS